MAKGAIWVGMVFIIFGIWLIIFSNFNIIALIYGIIAIILGIALVVLWKEEDKIEERKDINKKKPKK